MQHSVIQPMPALEGQDLPRRPGVSSPITRLPAWLLEGCIFGDCSRARDQYAFQYEWYSFARSTGTIQRAREQSRRRRLQTWQGASARQKAGTRVTGHFDLDLDLRYHDPELRDLTCCHSCFILRLAS